MAIPRLICPGTKKVAGTGSCTPPSSIACNLTRSQPLYSINMTAWVSLFWALPATKLAARWWSPLDLGRLSRLLLEAETPYQLQIFGKWLISCITLHYSALRICIGNFDFVSVILNHYYILCNKSQSEPCHQTLWSLTFTTSYFSKTTFADTFGSGSLSSQNRPRVTRCQQIVPKILTALGSRMTYGICYFVNLLGFWLLFTSTLVMHIWASQQNFLEFLFTKQWSFEIRKGRKVTSVWNLLIAVVDAKTRVNRLQRYLFPNPDKDVWLCVKTDAVASWTG